ncbi:hypothetical protein MASSI9I_20494 [Massilia sp. 9I]|nr:hypothetical protein MASSI9I_20494 [Massilia sp. 9I]
MQFANHPPALAVKYLACSFHNNLVKRFPKSVDFALISH